MAKKMQYKDAVFRKYFMEAHREEVANMFTEEFDYDRAIEVSREEARDDEKQANVIGMIKEGFNLEAIARVSRLTVAQVTSIGKKAALL